MCAILRTVWTIKPFRRFSDDCQQCYRATVRRAILIASLLSLCAAHAKQYPGRQYVKQATCPALFNAASKSFLECQHEEEDSVNLSCGKMHRFLRQALPVFEHGNPVGACLSRQSGNCQDEGPFLRPGGLARRNFSSLRFHSDEAWGNTSSAFANMQLLQQFGISCGDKPKSSCEISAARTCHFSFCGGLPKPGMSQHFSDARPAPYDTHAIFAVTVTPMHEEHSNLLATSLYVLRSPGYPHVQNMKTSSNRKVRQVLGKRGSQKDDPSRNPREY